MGGTREQARTVGRRCHEDKQSALQVSATERDLALQHAHAEAQLLAEEVSAGAFWSPGAMRAPLPPPHQLMLRAHVTHTASSVASRGSSTQFMAVGRTPPASYYAARRNSASGAAGTPPARVHGSHVGTVPLGPSPLSSHLLATPSSGPPRGGPSGLSPFGASLGSAVLVNPFYDAQLGEGEEGVAAVRTAMANVAGNGAANPVHSAGRRPVHSLGEGAREISLAEGVSAVTAVASKGGAPSGQPLGVQPHSARGSGLGPALAPLAAGAAADAPEPQGGLVQRVQSAARRSSAEIDIPHRRSVTADGEAAPGPRPVTMMRTSSSEAHTEVAAPWLRKPRSSSGGAAPRQAAQPQRLSRSGARSGHGGIYLAQAADAVLLAARARRNSASSGGGCATPSTVGGASPGLKAREGRRSSVCDLPPRASPSLRRKSANGGEPLRSPPLGLRASAPLGQGLSCPPQLQCSPPRDGQPEGPRPMCGSWRPPLPPPSEDGR